jgi:hypothetical protein
MLRALVLATVWFAGALVDASRPFTEGIGCQSDGAYGKTNAAERAME